jgi:hypothetical protein
MHLLGLETIQIFHGGTTILASWARGDQFALFYLSILNSKTQHVRVSPRSRPKHICRFEPIRPSNSLGRFDCWRRKRLGLTPLPTCRLTAAPSAASDGGTEVVSRRWRRRRRGQSGWRRCGGGRRWPAASPGTRSSSSPPPRWAPPPATPSGSTPSPTAAASSPWVRDLVLSILYYSCAIRWVLAVQLWLV